MRDELTWRIRQLETAVSTNEEIKRALEVDEPEGLVVCARQQTGGYGRQRRGWKSPPGGLYMSLLLRPHVEATTLPTLSLAVSIAVRRALSSLSHSQDIMVKWPNDLVVPVPEEGRGAACCHPFPYSKLCGISLEVHNRGICVGVGVNVIASDREVRVEGKNTPIFLADLGYGGTIDAARDAILREMEACYSIWHAQGFTPFVREYNEHLALKNTQIAMMDQGGATTVEGVVLSVDKQGCLTLRVPDGSKILVSSGEAHVL